MTRNFISKNSRLALVAAVLFLAACQKRVPIVQIPKTPLGDGGKILRQFYRGFWEPPGSDDESITIGLVPSATRVRFRTLSTTVIRVFSEIESFEIVAEPGTTFRVEAKNLVRPAMVTYLPIVETRLLPRSRALASSSEQYWKDRGFSKTRWMGPPAMDLPDLGSHLQRWALSLDEPMARDEAKAVCARARKIRAGCRILPRVDLPPLARGRIEMEDGPFAKLFEGFVEIQSEGGQVRVLDFLAEPRVEKLSEETYATPAYVLPLDQHRVSLVQKARLRDYLDAVVPSEIFASAALEAVKAQAVVARTYAMRHLSKSTDPEPFMICASTLCQVYRGVGYVHPNASRAVRETASMVLWSHEGEPAETFYHGICGGHTESQFVLRSDDPEPYLAGISDFPDGKERRLTTDDAVARYLQSPASNDAYCGASTFTKADRWRWTETHDRAALEKIVAKAGLSGTLTDLRSVARGVSGRILSLKIVTSQGSKIIQGELAIRTLFGGLLSSLMLLEPTRERGVITALTIRGAGYGHGVGLCQVGAIGRAEAGQSFGQILEAYYPGTTLAPIGSPK